MSSLSLRAIIEEKLGKRRYTLVHPNVRGFRSSASSGSETMSGEDSKRTGVTHSNPLVLAVMLMACTVISSVLTCIALRNTGVSCAVQITDGPLMKTPVPTMPKEMRFFEFNWTFVRPPTPERDQAWNDILPFGRGYVLVENGAQYGLEPGIDTKDGEVYSIAMYHQLHCLVLVRRNYWRLMDGILNSNTSIMEEAEIQLANSHTGHCFDYFRQSFQCAADMSLEWPKTEKDGKRLQVNGKDIPHVCTSQRAVHEFMKAHHAPVS